MRWMFLLVIGMMFSVGSIAQENRNDSLEDAKIMYEFYYKTKFQVRLTHESTLLTSGVDIKLNALQVGFQFKQHYKIGVHGFISKSYETTKIEVPEVHHYNTAIIGYGAYFEYVFVENYRYYIGAPITLSSGWVSALAENENYDRLSEYDRQSNNFGIFSVGANGGYNVNYWLTVSTGLGYRWSFSKLNNENNLLTTPFYAFGVKVKFGHFLTTTFHHKRVNKMKSIYFRDKDTWRANKFKKKHPNL